MRRPCHFGRVVAGSDTRDGRCPRRRASAFGGATRGTALVAAIALVALMLALATAALLMAKSDLQLFRNLRDGVATYYRTRSAVVEAIAKLSAGYHFDSLLVGPDGAPETADDGTLIGDPTAPACVLQASDEAIWGASDWTESDLREDWERIDLARDAWLVELDGRLAGVAQLLDRKGARFIGDAYVHPEMTGRGVGARMLALLEARSRELEGEWPGDERVVLQAANLVGDDRAPELFRAQGFTYARSFFRMVVDIREPHPPPEWPDDVELRPFDVERDGRAVHAAVEEAFAHEWGHVAQPYDAWRERAYVIPRIDPSLVPVVWDGEEVAAFSLNYPKRNGDWGWIGTLGVREDWRRHGLGSGRLSGL